TLPSGCSYARPSGPPAPQPKPPHIAPVWLVLVSSHVGATGIAGISGGVQVGFAGIPGMGVFGLHPGLPPGFGYLFGSQPSSVPGRPLPFRKDSHVGIEVYAGSAP